MIQRFLNGSMHRIHDQGMSLKEIVTNMHWYLNYPLENWLTYYLWISHIKLFEPKQTGVLNEGNKKVFKINFCLKIESKVHLVHLSMSTFVMFVCKQYTQKKGTPLVLLLQKSTTKRSSFFVNNHIMKKEGLSYPRVLFIKTVPF